MTPQWYTITSTKDDKHTTIPYHQMWEEARQWLPAVLTKYFSNDTDTDTDVTADAASQSNSHSQQQYQSNSTSSSSNNNNQDKKRYFIRKVEFGGGYNRETGVSMDCWHGMGKHRIDWVDELPESRVTV